MNGLYTGAYFFTHQGDSCRVLEILDDGYRVEVVTDGQIIVVHDKDIRYTEAQLRGHHERDLSA